MAAVGSVKATITFAVQKASYHYLQRARAPFIAARVLLVGSLPEQVLVALVSPLGHPGVERLVGFRGLGLRVWG